MVGFLRGFRSAVGHSDSTVLMNVSVSILNSEIVTDTATLQDIELNIFIASRSSCI
jgi:hypothetical protein